MSPASDLAVDEEDVRNLRTALRQGLQQRHYGEAVRLEVSAGCSDFLSDFLRAQFNLPAPALYRVHGPVNLVRLGQLIDLADAPNPAVQAITAVLATANAAGRLYPGAAAQGRCAHPPAV